MQTDRSVQEDRVQGSVKRVGMLNRDTIWVYNMIQMGLLALGSPVVLPAMCLSKKRRKTAWHRLGIRPMAGATPKDSAGPRTKSIWLHALSVGEVAVAGPLVDGLTAAFPDRRIRFSVSTLTGFETADRSVKGRVDAIFYFPYDLIFSVRRAVRAVDPAVVIVIETDVWPNFLFVAHKNRVPVILVNARISRRSFSRYYQFLPLAKRLFSSLSHVCVPTEADAGRFKQLGVAQEQITITGNLKFDQKRSPGSPREINDLKTRLKVGGEQKIFVAGSTHKGEEAVLLEAFTKISQQEPNACLIIAPRDPNRANAVISLFQSRGFSSILYRQQTNVDSKKQAQVIVVDSLGVLIRLYDIADVVFVGGSLNRCGGHNPLEPAAASKPILFGPDMSDFEAIARRLTRARAAFVVNNVKEVADTVVGLFTDVGAASMAGQRAFQVFDAESGATRRTVGVVGSYLHPATALPGRN